MAKARHRRRRSRRAGTVAIVVVTACLVALLVGVKGHLPGASSDGASSGAMTAPSGYTSQQLIFDDKFSGTSLDTSKWTTALGAQGIVWNNHGALPSPYSGPNVPGDGTEAAMFGPSQVTVNNGLTLTAQRNANRYAGSYPWISGVVTTEGKFSLPDAWLVRPGEGQDARPVTGHVARHLVPSGGLRNSEQRVRRLRGRGSRWGSERERALELLRGPGPGRRALERRDRRHRRLSPLRVPVHPGPVHHRLLRREAGVAGAGVERHHHHRRDPTRSSSNSRWPRRRDRGFIPRRRVPPRRRAWKSPRSRRTPSGWRQALLTDAISSLSWRSPTSGIRGTRQESLMRLKLAFWSQAMRPELHPVIGSSDPT